MALDICCSRLKVKWGGNFILQYVGGYCCFFRCGHVYSKKYDCKRYENCAVCNSGTGENNIKGACKECMVGFAQDPDYCEGMHSSREMTYLKVHCLF